MEDLLDVHSRVRQLSTQIHVVLVVQALTPVALELMPTFLTTICVVLDYQIASTTALFSALLNWAPLINALSAILIVKPYRQAVWRVVMLRKVVSTIVGDKAAMPGAIGTQPTTFIHNPQLVLP